MPLKKHQNGFHSPKAPKLKRRERKNTKRPNVIIVSCCVIVFALLVYELHSYLKTENATSNSNNTNSISFSNGGWKLANAEIEEIYGTSVCDIDRRSAMDLSGAEFEDVYRFRKPVIVTFPRGAGDWTLPEMWTLTSLRKEYADWSVLSGNSREIVRRGGSGDVHTTFGEYLDELMGNVDSKGEPYYVFDRHFYNDSRLPVTLHPPSYFNIQDGVHDSLFFLGGSGSGVSFHKHADAWNGVVYGSKRWFLYPLDTTPPGGVYPGFTQLEWYDQVYPNLPAGQQPMECVQGPGEIFYIPEGIYHATINLGDTVAVGIQRKEATTDVQRLFYEEHEISVRLAEEDNEATKSMLLQRTVEIYERLIQLLPHNAEVHMKIGRLYADLSRMGKALYHTEKAIELDGHFIIAILNLADIQAKKGNIETAEKLYKLVLHMNPMLWDGYAHYGDFLSNQNRPDEAVVMYRKGTELEPKMLTFWTHLQFAQQRAGDVTGAQETQEHIHKLQHQ